MARSGLDIELPPTDAAPGDGGVVRPRGALELEHSIGPPRLGDQFAAHNLHVAGVLFIAGEHDGNRGVLQGAGVLQGLQGKQDDGIAAFHVHYAGPNQVAAVACECLKRTRRLKDGIQMPEQKHHGALTATSPSEQMAGAPDGIRVTDPFRRHPQFPERCVVHGPHGAHPLHVKRSAVDRDGPLQERKRFIGAKVHRIAQRLFDRCKRLAANRAGECREDDEGEGAG